MHIVRGCVVLMLLINVCMYTSNESLNLCCSLLQRNVQNCSWIGTYTFFLRSATTRICTCQGKPNLTLFLFTGYEHIGQDSFPVVYKHVQCWCEISKHTALYCVHMSQITVLDRREQTDVRMSVPKIFDVWQSLLNVLN